MSSNQGRVTIKAPQARKTTGNHLTKSTFLGKLRPLSLVSAKVEIEYAVQLRSTHWQEKPVDEQNQRLSANFDNIYLPHYVNHSDESNRTHLMKPSSRNEKHLPRLLIKFNEFRLLEKWILLGIVIKSVHLTLVLWTIQRKPRHFPSRDV